MDQYQFPCEPIANDNSVIKGSNYRFTLINEKVLRFEWAEDGVFEDRASTFAINRKFATPEYRLEDGATELIITTPHLRLSYDKQRFASHGLVATFTAKMNLWGSEWRYGEDATGNLGGTARTLDGVDGRCDMGAGILSRDGYAVLDDSASMLFDGKGFVAPRRQGDRIDGYLFFYGFDFQGAMKSFYDISGRQPTVPRWCLGNWWSRYYAYNQDEYVALMDKFQEQEIPLSVAVIDMDWHWVLEDIVPHTGWTGFTWNSNLFPDHVKFAKDLHSRGLKITLNDHPHAGIAHHEEVYQELAKVLNHDTTHNDPIPFDPSSSKFMHAFFNVVHRKLENEGCDFWWIDWQQGTHSRTGLDPLWLLNHFQFLDTQQTQTDSNAIIFSRYAGPGSHRYPVGFSGDTFATWASLQFQPEFTATASNIGYGWWSHDIGGHLPGSRDDECATRWVQHGVFSPILRLHSSNSRWMSKEPWLYRGECNVAMKNAMQLRHRLVPYIFSSTAMEEALPLVRPLYWKYPRIEEAYGYPNQYYFGDSLLVAPVVTPSSKITNLAKTKVWVPPGRHVDILTGVVYDGDQEINMYRSLDKVPVLAPEGSIIPLDGASVPKNGCKNPTSYELLVVIGADAKFELLEDPRDDEDPAQAHEKGKTSDPRAMRHIPITYSKDKNRLTTINAGKNWKFRFISTNFSASCSSWVDYSAEGHPSVVVEVPASSNYDEVIDIDLSGEPHVDVLDHTSALERIIRDFQIEVPVKDKIWSIVGSKQPMGVRVSRLLALGLEEELYGPIAELLLADSRCAPIPTADA